MLKIKRFFRPYLERGKDGSEFVRIVLSLLQMACNRGAFGVG